MDRTQANHIIYLLTALLEELKHLNEWTLGKTADKVIDEHV